MGCFYTGFDYKNRKNGYFKIGETEKNTPAARLSAIRSTDSFQCLGWIRLLNETKAQRLYIEAYVRMMMEKHPELTHTQNDHYLYVIKSKEEKYSQAQSYADLAIAYAINACNIAGIKWEMGTKTYKRS